MHEGKNILCDVRGVAHTSQFVKDSSHEYCFKSIPEPLQSAHEYRLTLHILFYLKFNVIVFLKMKTIDSNLVG